jgi:glutathione S-transferase
MKLYGSDTSPYVRKLRVMIKEKQLPVEYVLADPRAPDSPIPALNPLGLVPVLLRDDGSTLFDSPVVAEFLDSMKAPPLIPAAGESRWQVLRWAALGDGILDQAVARTMELRRPGPQQSAEANGKREEKIARAMDHADAQLGDGAWLIDNRYTLADIALAASLEYVDFRYPHEWRGARPRLARWLAAISARAAFVDTRPPAGK